MSALQIALRYLERRAHTEQELRQKLEAKATPPHEIEVVLSKLKGYGYVDDAKFARDWQRARNDYRPMGIRRIQFELRRKGVAKEIVRTISAEREEEYQLAFKAAAARRWQYQGLEPQTFRRRMAGFLTRRGFNYDIIKAVLSSLE